MATLTRAPLSEQIISAATGFVTPRIEVCRVAYTATGAVTDLFLSSTWVKYHSHTIIVDTDGNAATNNITIKNAGGVTVAVIDNDGGVVTVYSDGTDIYVQSTTSQTFDNVNIDGGTIDGTVIGGAVPAAGTFTDCTAATFSGNGAVPPGVIFPFAGALAQIPTGYLACNGSSVLRADYPALFAAIGTAWGTADGTHFNLPDGRGKFLRGVDHAVGNDPDRATRTAQAAGGATGDAVASIQADAFKSHTHVQNAHNHSAVSGWLYALYKAASGVFSAVAGSGFSTNSTTADATATNKNTGGNETRPINAYVEWIIKY